MFLIPEREFPFGYHPQKMPGIFCGGRFLEGVPPNGGGVGVLLILPAITHYPVLLAIARNPPLRRRRGILVSGIIIFIPESKFPFPKSGPAKNVQHFLWLITEGVPPNGGGVGVLTTYTTTNHFHNLISCLWGEIKVLLGQCEKTKGLYKWQI